MVVRPAVFIEPIRQVGIRCRLSPFWRSKVKEGTPSPVSAIKGHIDPDHVSPRNHLLTGVGMQNTLFRVFILEQMMRHHPLPTLLIPLMMMAACGSAGSSPDLAGDVPDVGVPDSIQGDLMPDDPGGPDVPVVSDASDAVEPVDSLDAVDAADSVGDEGAPFDFRVRWNAPAGPWPVCDEVAGTSKTLAAKAAYYDWIGPKLHQEPKSGSHEDTARMYNVDCDGPVPVEIVPDDQLPNCVLRSSENNGLWTSMYVASQCFRYGATGDAEALANALRTLKGTYELMQITGRPGLYAREASDPGIAPIQTCPEDPMEYRPPEEGTRKGNYWVKVDTDGCMLDYHSDSAEWVKHPDVCTDLKYAGRCWKRNVSKDEYSGHAYAAGVCAKVVDDPAVRGLATEILSKIAHHLKDNAYWLTDYDGLETRYGSIHAMSLDHIPGFNAKLALVWVKSAAMASGEQELIDEYYKCLLQSDGELRCIERETEFPVDYTTFLDELGLKIGCQTNFDNVSMMMLAYLNEIWFEPSKAERARFRALFEQASRGPDTDDRDIWSMKVPFYNFMIAAAEGDEAMTAERRNLIESMVNDGICVLKNFQETQIERDEDTTVLESVCESDRHGPLIDGIVPIEDRCPATFEWWGDPSSVEKCSFNPNVADNPAGFLAPYWMGRYFGFISEDM